jgi:hypothetical protein
MKRYNAGTSAGDLDATSTSIDVFPSLDQETEDGEVPEIMEDERGNMKDQPAGGIAFKHGIHCSSSGSGPGNGYISKRSGEVADLVGQQSKLI